MTEQGDASRLLEALHGVTRDLLTAETKDAAASIAVEAASDVLGFEGTGLRLHDPDRDALVSVSFGGDRAAEITDGPDFDVDATPHGEAFTTGETVVHDVTPDERDTFGPFRQTMYVPLGDHGVLSLGKTDATITDEERRYAEILAANAAAALDRIEREAQLRAERARLDEFAGVASHDLRNPLNVARGHLDLSREQFDSDHLDAADRALARMERLVSELLTLSRSGQVVGDTETVDLRDVAEDAWDTVATEGATLVVERDATLVADRRRLRQLLENLFRNSIQHAGDAPTVTVTATDEGFVVADDGPGIPVTDRKTIAEGGSLGLTIVRRIAESHGWTLDIGNDDGARFEIRGTGRSAPASDT
ncbi:sensor histidine kinase [Halosegnis longus]|uniref:histidine kinase n=1 Tax=Halosegnis longus TaxID=2216012 RepID=A0AAJ4UUY7_9EURY|nr:sensor histidine kinase [Salella cibi]